MKKLINNRYGRVLVLSLAGLILLSTGVVAFGSLGNTLMGFSSSNAVLYLVKNNGWFEFRDDLAAEEKDRLFFMLDMSCVFHYVEMLMSALTGESIVETTWDETTGRGVVKEYNPDGTQFLLVLSRMTHGEGGARGLFVGGALPYGDIDRFGDAEGNNTGMAFYDGSNWIHLWCNANEGIGAAGGGRVIEPPDWQYLSSRVVKRTPREAILESSHAVEIADTPLLITRSLYFRAGDGFVTLRVGVTNVGDRPVAYDYAYGDEPWLGRFGSSAGDVGWYEGGYVIREAAIDPTRYSMAGFADIGNRDAGEMETYSGYANFIQWVDPPPTHVYFSNDFQTMGAAILDSDDNRVINMVWNNVHLAPGESAAQILRIGFMRPGENLLVEARGFDRHDHGTEDLKPVAPVRADEGIIGLS